MACINHVLTQPGCLACQVSSIGQEQQATARDVQQANALQVEALEYQAVAAAHAEATRYAAERQSANTASYEFSMWRQSANGKYWNNWSVQAQGWINRASGHDAALREAWREAAVSSDELNKIKDAKNHADFRLWGCAFGFCFGVVGFILGHVVQFLFGTGKIIGSIAWFMTPVCKWMVPIFAISTVFWLFRDFYRRDPPETQVAKLPGALAIKEKYGANPFEDPENLPSFRPGMTCAQAADAIRRVDSLASLKPGFYPTPGQLPKLPTLTIRDMSDWPPVVIEAAQKHFKKT